MGYYYGTWEIQAAAATDPVTLDEAKAHLRIDATDDDPWLQANITAATNIAQKFANRQLVTATYDWFLPGFCWDELRVPMPPLQSVTSITYLDTGGTSTTLSASLYQVDANREPGLIRPAYGQWWPSTRVDTYNVVTVRFVAGYGAASAVPKELKTAILLWLGELYENRENTTPLELREIPMGAKNLLRMDGICTF